MSEYSPTFVNRDKAPKPTGGKEVIRSPSPAASDLHIVFNKGGVEIKDKGSAEKADYGDAQRNSVDLTFPADKPIQPAPYLPPATPQPDGTPAVTPPSPPNGTFTTPTFTHSDPVFPGIKEWWWTHNVWRHGKLVNERCKETHVGDPVIQKVAPG